MHQPYYRLGLVMEQNLGHITHAQNLGRWLRDDPNVQPTWINVPPGANDIWQRFPSMSLKASLRAREMVHNALDKEPLDCLLYHTQLISLFSLEFMKRIPTVISMDATPINFNAISAGYDAQTASGVLGSLKLEWYKRIFKRAAALVTWSNWAKESLVQDYGVAPDKVTVIPPGIDLNQWHPTVKAVGKGESLRLLFVGGEFRRKGGHTLLEAFRSGLADCCTLDIVTKSNIESPEESVRVHQGLTANSPLLQQLFADADLFVLPTLGDTNAIVILEAMASGLPVVATNVGAIPEEVEDGITGFIVPPNDPSAIVEAVLTLADNPERLAAMRTAARTRAERLFSGERTYKALIEILKRCAQEHRGQ